MKRVKVTKESILDSLPTPPDNHSYKVDKFSSLVYRVWLVNHNFFSYTPDEVKTVWGFVKSTGDVMAPKKWDKISSTKVCHVSDIPQSLRYTTMIPKYTELKTKD